MKTFDELKALIDQRGVHAVFGEPGEGWAIEQNSAELAEFLVEMQRLGVTSALEIGTGYKAGLARFLHDDMGWRVTSVDIKSYGHSFDGIRFVTARSYGHELDFFPSDEEATVNDLVIIDADHAYEQIKADHYNYSPFATKVIAFHDIAGLRDCEGARDYWNEIAHPVDYDHEGGKFHDTEFLNPGYHEIIAEGDQRGGIGYIVLAEVAIAERDIVAAMTAAGGKEAGDLAQNLVDHPAKKPAPRKPAAKKTAVKK